MIFPTQLSHSALTQPIPQLIKPLSSIHGNIQPKTALPSLSPFVRPMREFPSNILLQPGNILSVCDNSSETGKLNIPNTHTPDQLNVSESIESVQSISLTRTQELAQTHQKIAQKYGFYHISADEFIAAEHSQLKAQTLEHTGTFLSLSAQERNALVNSLNGVQTKATINHPSLAQRPLPQQTASHQSNDRLYLLTTVNQSLSSIHNMLGELLGVGFNDRLFNAIVEHMSVESGNILENQAIDITTIRDIASQNTLAQLLTSEHLDAFKDFLQWVKASQDFQSQTQSLFMTQDAQGQAYELLQMAQYSLLEVMAQTNDQLPQPITYGEAVHTDKTLNLIRLTGQLDAMNQQFLSTLSNSSSGASIKPAERTTKIISDEKTNLPSLMSPIDLCGDQQINPKIHSLVKVPKGCSKANLSELLDHLYKEQLFSKEKMKLLSTVDWLNDTSSQQTYLDVSEFTDRISLKALDILFNSPKLEQLRSMSESILRHSESLADLNLYQLSQEFMTQVSSQQIEVLSEHHGQLLQADQRLNQVINLLGRSYQHTNTSSTWDLSLYSDQHKQITRHLIALLQAQNINFEVREIPKGIPSFSDNDVVPINNYCLTNNSFINNAPTSNLNSNDNNQVD